MGGAVSSGRDNNELIDNLMGGNYIRTRCVERVFRALDRADYMTPEARDQAYKDLAWRNGPLHMSAPCIYSEVMEGLELRPGLSFLNVGSGTGYLSTLVGLIIGSSGISHGVEVHPLVVEYSTKKMSQFLENSPTLDEFDFCEPKFYGGNGLCLAPLQSPYDRVYCGAGCPEEYQNYFKQLIKVGGVLVMPLNDNLVQVRRVGDAEWSSRSLLNVSFATLRVPTKDEASDLIKLEEQAPPRLQQLARGVIRGAMRAGLMRRHPELREPPQRQPPAKKSCPRRICIPIEDDSDVEGLNALHDMDRNGGAHEMNALLSLVLSMGQNRVAGALRFDPLDSPLDSEEDDDDDAGDDDDADDGSGGGGGTPRSDPSAPRSKEASPESSEGSGSGGAEGAGAEAAEAGEGGARATFRSRRGLLTFEFRDAQPAREPPSEPVAPSTSATDAGADAPAADGDATATKSREEPRSGPSRDDDDDNDSPGVPAEVEIFLGKSQPGCSKLLGQMDWEHDTIEEEDDEFFSEEDEEAVEDQAGDKACEEDKRQKLDSGIGEESTPTSEASPGKSDAKTDDSDAEPGRSGSLTDDMDDNQDSRRRLQKRGRRAGGRSSASNSWSDSSTASGSGGTPATGSAARRRCKRRAPDAAAPTPAPPGPDARRVRLSVLMKRGVKELPLPHALKKYVNLGRCFEF